MLLQVRWLNLNIICINFDIPEEHITEELTKNNWNMTATVFAKPSCISRFVTNDVCASSEAEPDARGYDISLPDRWQRQLSIQCKDKKNNLAKAKDNKMFIKPLKL